MQIDIAVVELLENFSESGFKLLEVPTRQIVKISEIHNNSKTYRQTTGLGNGKINRLGDFGYLQYKHWEDDDDYTIVQQPVKILHSFTVITNGHFVRNTKESGLNAYRSFAGFREISRLLYSASAMIVKSSESDTLSEYDVVWSGCELKSTQFDMYSYHIDGKYHEDQLDWEIFNSLDLNSILKDYLYKSDIRNSKLEDLGF